MNSPTNNPPDSDLFYMHRALELAHNGIFSAAPNPRVGCVIVKNHTIIGEGWHQRAGEAHAEINALNAAGTQARDATVYVTLEPCAHFGRTPPCTHALITAGVKRVVIACSDPNPLVAGKGIAALRTAGISVEQGICAQEALQLNRPFFHRMRWGRPWVTLKIAASMDGRTALANGESQWITGELARKDVHFHRLAADAVLAGTGSVIGDNARLTARFPTDLPANPPLRVVIDSQLKTPANAALFCDPSPILMVTTQPPPQSSPQMVEYLSLPATEQGKVPLSALLDELGRRQINHLFVEAGMQLTGAFLTEQLVDEILLYLAPTFLGDSARPLVALPPLAHLSDRMRFSIADAHLIGDDWRLSLLVNP